MYTATMIARKRLIDSLYVHCLSSLLYIHKLERVFEPHKANWRTAIRRPVPSNMPLNHNEYRYSSTLSLTSAIGGFGWSRPHHGRFTHVEFRYPS